jgi:nitrogen fixation protein FixH
MRIHWHWGTRIALVYAVFAGGTLGFAVFAMRQDVDLVSPDYYAESMSYDARQAASSRTLALGDGFGFEPAQDGRAITIRFPVTARPESGRLTLYRASDSHADRSLDVDPRWTDSTGRLRFDLHDIGPGQWTAKLDWTAGGRQYFAEQRIVVP